MTNSGLLITFEGYEGAGKTTAAQFLYSALQRRSVPVILTREPGGTLLGGKLREILCESNRDYKLSPTAELFLFITDRAQHVEYIIKPALKNNFVVICDRFLDSTLAYQGAGNGHSKSIIQGLHDMATNGLLPNRTYLLSIPTEVGLDRVAFRNETLSVFERRDNSFQRRVANYYKDMESSPPPRIRVIDAARPQPEVHMEILADTLSCIRQYTNLYISGEYSA